MNAPPPTPSAPVQVLERARAFVGANGDVLARERLAVLLGESPAERVEAVLEAWRSGDGGVASLSQPPPLLPGTGTLDGTLAALGILDEAGIRRGLLLEGAVHWLGCVQDDDGAWRVHAGGGVAPDADPIYLTGMLAGHLAKVSCGSPRTLARAEAFLAAQFTPERVEDGGWDGLTAYAHVCTNGAFERSDEALQWCGRALEKGFRSGRLGALDVARTLLVRDVRALPASRVDADEVLLALLPLQQPDGGFAAADRPLAERVEATLVAARAIVRFSRKGAAWTAA